jgi:hypothetical protein
MESGCYRVSGFHNWALLSWVKGISLELGRHTMKTEKAGAVAQVVECLPSKETLSSNSSTARKKKK